MGKQITFYMDMKTEQQFKDFILQEGEIIVEGSNPNPISVKILPEPFSDKGWFKLYLYKKEYGELVLDSTANGRKYIDETKSPVIEFLRTVVREDEKEVSRGRLWLEMKYWDVHGRQVEKAKALNDWYTNLCKWVKNQLPKTEFLVNEEIYTEYISDSIKKSVENGYKIF